MSGQRRVTRKGELEKGGEVKRSQEPGVRGVEEDKEGDGCFGGVPCKKKKKQSECPTVRVQLPLQRGRDYLSICQ